MICPVSSLTTKIKASLISDKPIAAASCILPLTSRIDLRAKYGTRHRAAIGLSEISDALILVVSEETGHITFFYKGTIEENLSINRVETLLKNSLLNEK